MYLYDCETNELYHHGILGMHWGIRRFQNKDGTLTEAGKKHVSRNSDEKPKIVRKRLRDMTDAELKESLDRLKREKEYMETYKSVTDYQRSRGEKFVIDVLEKIGKNTLENIGTQVANHYLGEMVNKLAGVSSNDKDHRLANPQKGQSDKK